RVGLYDKYHRVLAYLRPDGARETVNELLLRQGFARVFVFDPVHPFARAPRFTRLAAEAQRSRSGLWGACPS
ncbi:MAG: thermonuclease family protein, partial [Thermoleophilia bacterium]